MTTPEYSTPLEPKISHDLKVWPEYFGPLASGVKTFEFRKDDREPRFAVGDVLRLHEWVPPYRAETEDEWSKQFGGDYTGREVLRRVTYLARGARGGVIPEGYCVMSLEEWVAPIQESPSPTPDSDAILADLNRPIDEADRRMLYELSTLYLGKSSKNERDQPDAEDRHGDKLWIAQRRIAGILWRLADRLQTSAPDALPSSEIEDPAIDGYAAFAERAKRYIEYADARDSTGKLQTLALLAGYVLTLYSAWRSQREELATLRSQLLDWENREAKVCPEDVGFEEYIGVLSRQVASYMRAEKAALGERDQAIASLSATKQKIEALRNDVDTTLGRHLAKLTCMDAQSHEQVCDLARAVLLLL